MKILKQLNVMPRSRWYWLVFVLGGVFLLSTALYYQYVREELPCTMCIQVRLWISLLVLISLVGWLLRSNTVINLLAQLSIILIAVALIERSYMLLGTERGFVFSKCGVNLGLPAWFAIEQWLPWLYGVETSCSYTPEIIFGITMAETLIVLSVTLLIVSLCVFLASLLSRQ